MSTSPVLANRALTGYKPDVEPQVIYELSESPLAELQDFHRRLNVLSDDDRSHYSMTFEQLPDDSKWILKYKYFVEVKHQPLELVIEGDSIAWHSIQAELFGQQVSEAVKHSSREDKDYKKKSEDMEEDLIYQLKTDNNISNKVLNNTRSLDCYGASNLQSISLVEEIPEKESQLEPAFIQRLELALSRARQVIIADFGDMKLIIRDVELFVNKNTAKIAEKCESACEFTKKKCESLDCFIKVYCVQKALISNQTNLQSQLEAQVEKVKNCSPHFIPASMDYPAVTKILNKVAVGTKTLAELCGCVSSKKDERIELDGQLTFIEDHFGPVSKSADRSNEPVSEIKLDDGWESLAESDCDLDVAQYENVGVLEIHSFIQQVESELSMLRNPKDTKKAWSRQIAIDNQIDDKVLDKNLRTSMYGSANLKGFRTLSQQDATNESKPTHLDLNSVVIAKFSYGELVFRTRISFTKKSVEVTRRMTEQFDCQGALEGCFGEVEQETEPASDVERVEVEPHKAINTFAFNEEEVELLKNMVEKSIDTAWTEQEQVVLAKIHKIKAERGTVDSLSDEYADFKLPFTSLDTLLDLSVKRYRENEVSIIESFVKDAPASVLGCIDNGNLKKQLSKIKIGKGTLYQMLKARSDASKSATKK